MKTNAALKKDVMDELKWEPKVNADAIGAAVKDGVVTLSGYVDSYLGKLNAEYAAQRVTGVRGVVQKIDVKLPGSSGRTDEDIARAAADALESHIAVPEKLVKVQVENGWVTLTGEVNWKFQKDAAHDAICCLMGVRGVLNLLTVKPSVEPTDVKTKIEAALVRHSLLDAKQIKIEVAGGKVILSGTVHSWPEKMAVGSSAWDAPGVSVVENNIDISP